MTKPIAIWTLVLILAISAASVWLSTGLKFDYDFEDFFPAKDSSTDYYFEFREAFESDNDFFLIALENDEGVFEYDFLLQVDSLAGRLRELEHVVEVVGPTDLAEYIQDPLFGGLFRTELLRWDTPENYPADSIRIFQSPGVVGVFFSPDAKSVAITMKHTELLSKKKCDELSIAIEREVSSFSFDHTHLIGRALGQRVYVEMMIKELSIFLVISLGLTLLFLFIAFRSGWAMVIPALVVLLSLIWTFGFMRLIGKDIDLMLTVLPTIIFVVGISDSVHVLTRYMEELRKGQEKLKAIRTAFRSIRMAMFLTSLTTAIGFLTLVFSNIRPISDFGVYTSVGIMLAYGLTYMILPALLILARPKRLYDFAQGDDFWSEKLHRGFLWLLQKRRKVLFGGLLVAVISTIGVSMIEVDNKMLEDLRDSHFLKQEFVFMEEHFAGCRPFELGVGLSPQTDPFSPTVISQLDTLHQYLEQEYGVGSLISFPAMIRATHKALNAGQQVYYSIPMDSVGMSKVRRVLRRKDADGFLNLVWNKEENLIRFAGKVGDTGRKHYEVSNEKLDQFIQHNCPDLRNYQVTGTAHLIDLNNEYLVSNMVWNLLLSVSMIGVVMGVVYRSWRMMILTIVPNLFPLLVVAGIMGFMGIPLKVSTSIIFNIAFGIAVDDTIHFLARTRSLIAEGLSRQYAVKRAFLTTGKAMIVTSLILSGGFLSLVFSDFLGTFYIGLLISLTLFIALIAELLYTPLAVLMFYRK